MVLKEELYKRKLATKRNRIVINDLVNKEVFYEG